MSDNTGGDKIGGSGSGLTGRHDSWVDLSGQMGTTTPPLIAASSLTPRSPATPPFGGENDYLRMLREAQRESNRSSTKVSPISSALMSLTGTPKRASPIDSPKSPPNSPNPELALHPLAEELRGVYINKFKDSSTQHSGGGVTPSDIVWDWTSRPNIPQKEWRLPSSARSRKSSGSSKVSFGKNVKEECGKKSIFSKEVMYTLVITNLLSLLLGTGIGIWLSRRSVESCGCCGDLIDLAL